MMNHLEDRPCDADWAVVQNNVVKYLLENRGLRDKFKEEEVLVMWLKYFNMLLSICFTLTGEPRRRRVGGERLRGGA